MRRCATRWTRASKSIVACGPSPPRTPIVFTALRPVEASATAASQPRKGPAARTTALGLEAMNGLDSREPMLSPIVLADELLVELDLAVEKDVVASPADEDIIPGAA